MTDAERMMPEAEAWARQITLPRGERWHWAKGTIALWLWLVAVKGFPRTDPEGQRIIWTSLWRMMQSGQITPVEADYLWRDIGGFSSSIAAEYGAGKGGGVPSTTAGTSSSSPMAGFSLANLSPNARLAIGGVGIFALTLIARRLL